MGKLDGKVALITGAGSGIGRATANLFAKEGARVAVVDRAPAGGRDTVDAIRRGGGQAIFIEADVSKATDAERMVGVAVNTYGRLDILHNHAGTSARRVQMAELTEDEWDDVIDTNLKSVFLASKHAIPIMVKQGGGTIINTAAIGGLAPAATDSAYCSSKGGVVLLTKAMALDYAKQNIRVNCICPGLIETAGSRVFIDDTVNLEAWMRRQPMSILGQPEDIARAALYLACDDSRFVTGTCQVVDGGMNALGYYTPPIG